MYLNVCDYKFILFIIEYVLTNESNDHCFTLGCKKDIINTNVICLQFCLYEQKSAYSNDIIPDVIASMGFFSNLIRGIPKRL